MARLHAVWGPPRERESAWPTTVSATCPYAGDELLYDPAPLSDLVERGTPPFPDAKTHAAMDRHFHEVYVGILEGRLPWSAIDAPAAALQVDTPSTLDRRWPKPAWSPIPDADLADQAEDWVRTWQPPQNAFRAVLRPSPADARTTRRIRRDGVFLCWPHASDHSFVNAQQAQTFARTLPGHHGRGDGTGDGVDAGPPRPPDRSAGTRFHFHGTGRVRRRRRHGTDRAGYPDQRRTDLAGGRTRPCSCCHHIALVGRIRLEVMRLRRHERRLSQETFSGIVRSVIPDGMRMVVRVRSRRGPRPVADTLQLALVALACGAMTAACKAMTPTASRHLNRYRVGRGGLPAEMPHGYDEQTIN